MARVCVGNCGAILPGSHAAPNTATPCSVRPGAALRFSDAGNLTRHVDKPVYEAALTYEPDTGAIEVIADRKDGMVGGSAPGRMVPAMAFAGAPRMHAGATVGLRHDEVPAILQRGERVLNRREAQQYGTGNAQNITINIQTRDAESFRQSRTQVTADIARVVAMGRRGM